MTTEQNRRIDDIRPAAPLQWDDAKSAAPAGGAPRLRLGQIAERLGFPLTADFLRELGFVPAGRERASVLYLETDFQPMCAALISRISNLAPASADNPSTAGVARVNELARFEAWARRTHRRAGTTFDLAYDGTYKDNRIAAKWSAWQAAVKDVATPASQDKPLADEVRDAVLEEAAEALDAMNDSSGDAAAYDQREQNIYELEREHAIADCASAIRALKSQGDQGEKRGDDA